MSLRGRASQDGGQRYEMHTQRNSGAAEISHSKNLLFCSNIGWSSSEKIYPLLQSHIPGGAFVRRSACASVMLGDMKAINDADIRTKDFRDGGQINFIHIATNVGHSSPTVNDRML